MRITKKMYFYARLAILALVILSALYLMYYRVEKYIDFVDENDKVVDKDKFEKEEQEQAEEFITENDCVLELGARYGTVSVVINKKLSNPTDHIVVEPDSDVWEALEKNKKKSDSHFFIVKGIISETKLSLEKSGYGTTQIEDKSSTLPHFTFDQVKAMVDKPFTVLVADCEGCIQQFLNENTEILQTLRLILLEEDQGDKCDYKAVKKLLHDYNFTLLRPGFHSVWVRK